MVEAVRLRNHVRIINISSSEVYGSAKIVPMREDHPLNPRTPYAASKISADAIFQSYAETFSLNIRTMRPFNMFGPRQNIRSYAGVIPIFVSKILKDEPLVIYGDGLQTRDFTFVKEATRAMVALADPRLDFTGVINIGTGVETNVLQIAEMVIRHMGVDGYPMSFVKKRVGDVDRHQADISKLRSVGVEQPAPIDQKQIGETVEYYQELLSNKS